MLFSLNFVFLCKKYKNLKVELARLAVGITFFHGRQALVQMVLESLPALAAEVAAPLSKIDEIVLLGGNNDRTSTEIGKLQFA